MKIQNSERTRLSGYVKLYKVYKDKKLLVSKSNLIVYLGREWILSRIFNLDNPNIQPKSNMYLSWVSFGSGGAPITSPLDPIPPSNIDLSLNSEIVINDTSPIYADSGKKHPIDNVDFIQDEKNAHRYLICRVDILLDETEANDNDINEAGLWISNSSNPGEANEFHLFAKTTFPTIRKRSDFGLQLLWYIYA